MNLQHDPDIHMIPIDQISVLNPRLRGKHKFKEIVDNIKELGLKKPVTVAALESNNGSPRYLLVCGEGRLEAYKLLGQLEVPAIVIEGTRDTFMLMSLAENLARKNHTAADLLAAVENLKKEGYSFTQIAKKIDVDETYVRGVLNLLQKGETRLVRAVMARHVPVHIAIAIARSDDKEVQKALTEAYENKELRGTSLLRARRIIEDRKTRGKGLSPGGRSKRANGMTPSTVLLAYQRETTRQRVVIQRAKLTETRLLFLVTALKRLFEDENFVNLLRAESLDTVPQYLATQLNGRPSTHDS